MNPFWNRRAAGSSAIPVASAASLNAYLAGVSGTGGGPVVLEYGTYSITEAVIIPDGVGLDMNGSAFSVAWAPSAALADDSTNAAVKFGTPAITGTVNTTLAARAKPLASSVVVTSATGIVAGMYLDLSGTNANDEGLAEGANMITTDLVQVASSYVSGTTIPLAWPTITWHAAGHTVKSVVGPVANCGIYNGSILAPGGTLAVGVLARYCRNFKMESLAFQGFSKAGIVLDKGSFMFDVCDIRGRGELNSLVFLDPAHLGRVTKFYSDGGLRSHANGVRRGDIQVNQDSYHVYIDGEGGVLNHTSCALWAKHGHDVKVKNIVARDADPGDAYTRCVASGEHQTTSFFGIFQTGSSPIPWANFFGGITLDDLTVSDPTTATVVGHDLWAFVLHDAYSFEGNNITVRNTRGLTNVRGVFCKDTSGVLQNVSVQGVHYGMRMEGSFGIDGMVRNYAYGAMINPVDGNDGIGLIFGADPTLPPVIFDNVSLSSNEGIRWDSASTVTIPTLIITHARVNGFSWPFIVPAVNKTGADVGQIGEFAELEPAAAIIADTPRLRTPTDQTRNKVVIATGPFDLRADGYVCFVAPLPQSEPFQVRVRAADAIQPGDFIEVDLADGGNTKPGAKAASSATAHCRAISYKAAGAEAMVRVTAC
jgi:hypothetical protein